jgi:hypothetical protein
MSAAIEATIIEHLHRLDDQRQAEVLDFVEYLASKSKTASPAVAWPQIDPSRDLAKSIQAPQKCQQEFDPMRYSGTVQWPVDGLAYQEAIRSEWE